MGGPAWSAKPIYMGLDGTFINAQPGKRFFEAKVGIVFTDQRIRVSQGRNLLLNKQYVGSCQSVSEFGKRLFCCATEMGVKKETELIVLADGARWISQLAKTQYPQARLILDWWHLKKTGRGNGRLANPSWAWSERCHQLGAAAKN